MKFYPSVVPFRVDYRRKHVCLGSNEPRFAMLLRAFEIVLDSQGTANGSTLQLLVGHQMMVQSNVLSLPPMLRQSGFADVSSGLTRSSFLAFISGKKPDS